MLRFSKGVTPPVLAGYQATPNAGWASVRAADKDTLRKALLGAQGHLCAYCQRRIRNPREDKQGERNAGGEMKVEHWLAQSGGKDALRWQNLLGVCPGDESKETGAVVKGERHCDTARGSAALYLHPVEGEGPNPCDFLAYTTEGKVQTAKHKRASHENQVRGDIGSLNLNARRLCRARVEVILALKRRLEKAQWTASALRKEYCAASLQPGELGMVQCEVVRYHLRRWARQQNVML
jgi:uncharacterized protein (TIGR02646 family)